MPKMVEVAKKYLKAGFSVIPVGSDKRPLVKWEEYQKRQATEAEIAEWFGSDVGIAIITGKISGITVVDVDAKSGGLETLKEIKLPPSWIVKTGGGGWHYYYAYCSEAKQTAGIYQGIDIRNDGGYVVAPPSLHKTGNRYSWMLKEELADFPIDLFRRETIVKQKNWQEIIKNGSTEGERNNTAASLFGKLMNLYQPKEWESVVYPIGQFWNSQNNPPLSERELKSVFNSIASRAVVKRTPTLYEILSSNFTPVEIAKNITVSKKFFSWGDAYMDEVLPLIEPKVYIVLFGQFGSGKTTFAMFMAKRNAEAGHKVCFLTLEMSREKLVRQYAFKRGGISKAQYKAGDFSESIFQKYAEEIKNIEYIGIDEQSTKTNYTLDDIEEIIKTKQPDILFIDNFNKLKGSGRNDIDIDNQTSSRLLFLTRQYKTAIVVLHHANKPSKERKKSILKGIGGLRGTNKINDDADIVVEIGRPTEEQLTEFPRNACQLGIYKDRDWDCRGITRLLFEDGVFFEENNKSYSTDIADSFGGYVVPNF